MEVIILMAGLKELREGKLLTQQELAEKVGVTASTIYRLEAGKAQPRFKVLRKLGEVLEVDPKTITFGDEQRKAS